MVGVIQDKYPPQRTAPNVPREPNFMWGQTTEPLSAGRAVEMGFDVVNNPAHYTEGRKIEPIEAIRDWNLDFLLGQVVRYVSRAGRKGDELEDLEKARFYLDRRITELKTKRSPK